MAMDDCKRCNRKPKKTCNLDILIDELTSTSSPPPRTHDDCFEFLEEDLVVGPGNFYICRHGVIFEGPPRLVTSAIEVRTFLVVYVRGDDEELTLHGKTGIKKTIRALELEHPGIQSSTSEDVGEDLRSWHCKDMPVRGPIAIPGPD